MTKLITLFVITGLLTVGLSAEEKKHNTTSGQPPVVGSGTISDKDLYLANTQPTVQAPTVESALRAEIAWLRLVVKELETRQKYADIVCSQSDMMKAKQDVIDAAQKMQAQAAQQKATTQ